MSNQVSDPTVRRQPGFNLLELPIVIKIAGVLVVLLVVSSLVTAQINRSLLVTAANDISYQQLETISRSQAFRVADAVNRESISLNRLAGSGLIQTLLDSYVQGEAESLGGVANISAELSIQLSSFMQVNSEIVQMAVVAPDGEVLTVTPARDESAVFDRNRWDWFETAMAGELFLGNPSFDGLTGNNNGVRLAIPIVDENNPTRILGVLYGIWDLSNINDIVNQGENQEGMLLLDSGQALLSSEYSFGQAVPSSLRDRFTGLEQGSFAYIDLSGQQNLYGFVRLSAITDDPLLESAGWVVAVRTPVEFAQRTATVLTQRVLLSSAIYTLLALVLVVIFIRQMLRPLSELTAAAQAIGEGDLSASIPVLPRDEVGRLAEIIRDLVHQLFSRVRRLQAAVQVSGAAIGSLDVDRMMRDVTRIMTDRFDFLDARIYLVDQAGRRAWLRAASGAEAQRLLQARHNVGIDEVSIVGRAIMQNEHQVARGKETLRRAGTSFRRMEVALPLRAGGRALGALYVSTEQLGVLDQEDIDLLTLIADQVSASVENARLYEQSVTNITEIEALNRRLTRQAWQDHLDESGAVRHTRDPQARWPSLMEGEVDLEQNRAQVYVDSDGRSVLSSPLILRGEAVGSIAVTRPHGEKWTRDEIALIESVAARMGMIAEGIRLVEESERRAQREQRVNQVSAELLQRASSVDNVLQAALSQLGNALGTDTVSLRIGPPPVDSDHRISASVAPGEPAEDDNEPNGAGGAAT